MNNDIMVSVCCIAYNQEKFIRKTLEGFVNQKTNFKFEVLIHDDASTDNTPNIIQEYADKYPKIIKPILQTKNQYSQRIPINITHNYSRAKGKYIAWCEGDDYWCDENKLQIQFDALENNPSCSMCMHKTQCIDVNDNLLGIIFPLMDVNPGILSKKEILNITFRKNILLFQTSSYFMRREVIENYLNGFRHRYVVGDKPLVLLALQLGDCYYVGRIMSRYRKDSGGLTSKMRDNKNFAILHYERSIEGNKQFDELMNFEFHNEFDYSNKFCEVQIYKLRGEFRKIISKEYREVFNDLNIKNKLLIYFGCVFPKLGLKAFEYFHKRNRNTK